MDIKKSLISTKRRNFLAQALSAAGFLCLGGQRILSMTSSISKDITGIEPAEHKFLADSEMSFADVFRFAFQSYYIPCLKSLAEAIGKNKFIEILKKSVSDSVAERQRERVKKLSKNDFATYIELSQSRRNRFVDHVLTDEVVEKTENFLRTKITECLWAKTFREADAADIGFAGICYPDIAMASAFNPKIKLIRPTTLMQGHDYCDFQYYWEG